MSLVRTIALAPIRFYMRFISPLTPRHCKYLPTCSEYAVHAVRDYGVLRGFVLAGWRLLRCNPWSAGGIDHVPAKGQLWHRHAADLPATDIATTDHDSSNGDAARQAASDEYSGQQDPDGQRERGEAFGSSSTVGPAEHRSAGTDLDAPPTAARQPMSGRSAA